MVTFAPKLMSRSPTLTSLNDAMTFPWLASKLMADVNPSISDVDPRSNIVRTFFASSWVAG